MRFITAICELAESLLDDIHCCFKYENDAITHFFKYKNDDHEENLSVENIISFITTKIDDKYKEKN